MIRKIGLAAVEENKLLLVKKKGLLQLIMPGGKIEAGETPEQCLKREIKEELNAGVEELKFLGKFEDKASGSKDIVTIELYSGKLIGKIVPKNEIESYVWFGKGSKEMLSPIVKNKILPFLKERFSFD
ncbi:MAG: NUDIX domain-containing protein [Candidatus Woesearchaeota archaeon]